MDCNNIKNEFPILHDGTSQGGRLPFALNPDYVKVDERTAADWIVFARSYSKFLQFYNDNNNLDGDWTPFWTKNPAIILANIAASRVDWFREETRLMFIEIQRIDGDPDEEQREQQNFSKLFDAVANLALQLDWHIDRLPADLPIRTSLKNLIKSSLAPALKNWIAWYKTASAVVPAPFPLIDSGNSLLVPRILNMKVLQEDLQLSSDVWNNNTFSNDWITIDAATDWANYVTLITSDDAIFNGATVGENINFAIGHSFFKNTFEAFLKGFSKAIKEARMALTTLLSNYNQHEPHFALFLAFLRLVQEERQYLNGFTDRHLRYYYEKSTAA